MLEVAIWDGLPDLPWRDKVALLTFLSLEQLPQNDCPVTHLFEGDKYIRELRLPKGTILTGREHLLGHEMQLLEGKCILIAPDGKFPFAAYASVHSEPGFQAVVYMVTDVLARTVHQNPTGCRDVELLESIWFGDAEPVIERGRLLHTLLLERPCQPQSLSELH